MTAAPGWYPDAQGTLQYWNGEEWAPQSGPAPEVYPAAQTGPAVHPEPQPEVVVDPQPSIVEPYAPLPPAAQQPAYVQPVYAPPVQPGYAAPVPAPAPGNGIAVAGFVVGLVSVFMPLVLGIVVAGTGLGLSIAGMVKSERTGEKRGLAIAGLVLSIVGLVLII